MQYLTHRRPVLLIFLLLATLLAAMVPLLVQSSAPQDSAVRAPAAEARGLIKCDMNANGTEDNDGNVSIFTGPYDPIVFHNVESEDPSEAQPHSHDFAGNRLIVSSNDRNALSYYFLRQFGGGGGADATSCRLFTDTALYWWPSVVCTKTSSQCPYVGYVIPTRQFSAYYRGFAGQDVHAGTNAIPAAARLVAYQSGTLGGGPGYGLSGWTCGQNSTVTGGQDTIPNCSGSSGGPGDSLTAHVNFPSCWNGRAPNHPGDTGFPSNDMTYGDTRDNDYGHSSLVGPYTSNDFIYPTNKTACPASHPYEVTQLRETVAFGYTGDGTDVALSSDLDAAGNVVKPRGSSFHVDFFNSWDQVAFDDMIARCVKTRPEANCSP